MWTPIVFDVLSDDIYTPSPCEDGNPGNKAPLLKHMEQSKTYDFKFNPIIFFEGQESLGMS